MTYLNSRLRAFTASFALFSLADARWQTSNTSAQSSDAVAVRYPIEPDEKNNVDMRETKCATDHFGQFRGHLILSPLKISPPVLVVVLVSIPCPESLLFAPFSVFSRFAKGHSDGRVAIFRGGSIGMGDGFNVWRFESPQDI